MRKMSISSCLVSPATFVSVRRDAFMTHSKCTATDSDFHSSLFKHETTGDQQTVFGPECWCTIKPPASNYWGLTVRNQCCTSSPNSKYCINFCYFLGEKNDSRYCMFSPFVFMHIRTSIFNNSKQNISCSWSVHFFYFQNWSIGPDGTP